MATKAEAARANGKKGGRPRRHPATVRADKPAATPKPAKPTDEPQIIATNPFHLTPREVVFVQAYLVDFNASRAYLAAGYRGRLETCGGLAARLIRRDRVARAITAATAARAQKYVVTQERVLEELARIGFADVRNIFETRAGRAPMTGVELYLQHQQGDRAFEALPKEAQDAWHAAAALVPAGSGGFVLKSPDQIDDNTAAAIAGIEVVTKSIGDGEVEYVHKIRTVDKIGGLSLLARHLGMLPTKVELAGAGGGPLVLAWQE